MTTFEQRLKAAREAAGFSQFDVAAESRARLPKPMRISQTKLQRLESGKVGEDNADPFEVCFLASLYGVTTSTISEIAAGHMEAVRDLVRDNACSSTDA
jgi:transcriptional regulator with XRE-family HTH domain